MKKEIFMAGIQKLNKAFQDKDLDAVFMWTYLNDLSDSDFMSAVDFVIMNSQQINKATNLIALIRDCAKESRMTADEAWGVVCNAAKSRGFRLGHGFTEPVLVKAINSVGWYDICFTDLEKLGYVRNSFIGAYKNILSDMERSENFLIAESKASELIEGLSTKLSIGETRK